MTTATLSSNHTTKRELLDRVHRDIVPPGARRVVVGDWQILDYSSCFGLEWLHDGGRQGAFVKLPKADIDRRSVLAESPDDRALAVHEYESLRLLERRWAGAAEGDIQYVRPLVFYEDLNAIVTKRAFARDLVHDLRVEDLQRRLGHGAQPVLAALGRLAGCLAAFHLAARGEHPPPRSTFSGSSVVGKVHEISAHLQAYRVSSATLGGLLARLTPWSGWQWQCRATTTLKGLDVRNVLRERGGRIWLLDPGRTKPDQPEADLARLLVTCRISYWGTPAFFARMTPAQGYERALRGGYGESGVDATVLSLLTIKELFKHWRAAYVALLRKQWPAAVTAVLRRSYIDSFYARQIGRELNRLERGARAMPPAVTS